MSSLTYRVLIHGGAGVISKENPQGPQYFEALKEILANVQRFIEIRNDASTLSAVDIVEFAIQQLENDPLFNAGRGGVYADNGTHELEASIMEGSNFRCGAASLITRIKNPISVARKVMEKTPHNYLIGNGAEQFAIQAGLEAVENSYFDTPHRHEQFLAAKDASACELDDSYKRIAKNNHNHNHTATAEEIEKKTGTVGCVVFYQGKLAAGTSTGGLTNKMSGRVGDSPIIGAGTYADNRYAAISCTGVGEEFIRYVVAYDVIARMSYGKKSLTEAIDGSFAERIPADTGGLIAIDHSGDYVMKFNTVGMFRGMLDSNHNAKVGIWDEEVVYFQFTA
jgi:beta-aspartyl-peptidase (threonine type)